MRIVETYPCILGESTLAGLPALLVRLAGCNLSCRYCDSAFARESRGRAVTVERMLADVARRRAGRVLITGGEPLLQAADVALLCDGLLRRNAQVLVETNGSLPLEGLPEGVIKVVDVKTPGSGEGSSFVLRNLDRMNAGDQLKLVLTGRPDYDWAVRFLAEAGDLRFGRGNVLFSPAWGRLSPRRLAEWMLRDDVPYRFHMQVHKVLWGGERGR